MWKVNKHFFVEKVNGKTYKTGACKPLKEKHLKPWHMNYGMLGGILPGGYKPKNKELILETFDVKDQNPYNTCSWNAYTLIRQISRKTVLSVKSIVSYAKSKGLLSGDGYSNLDNNARAGAEFGVAEETLLPDNKNNGNFNTYSSSTNLTKTVRDNASLNRSDRTKKFYVKTVAEYIKALEDGYGIEVGFTWRSAYNMSNGFSSPWLLPWGKGVDVGGHGTALHGFKNLVLDNNGYVIDAWVIDQNSYSINWGDHGNFYIKLSDLVNNHIVGMVEVDLTDEKFDELLRNYEGKQVKGINSGIYLIQDGKKRPFINPAMFFLYGGRYGKYGKTYEDINQSTLDRIPDGNQIGVSDSPYWPELCNNGLTPDFIKRNIEQVNVWIENPEVLKQITFAMKDLIELDNGKNQTQTLIDYIKNLFKL